jgi:glucose/arabinose dehydrogenase
MFRLLGYSALITVCVLLSLPARAGIALEAIDGDFSCALFVTSPPGDASRLFVVEQNGEIYIVTEEDGMLPGLFLDLFGITNYDGQELGLLGFAFDPDYASNGHVYISYTRDFSGQILSIVSRVTVSGSPATATEANFATEQQLLVVEQPYANHNGGMIAFGPDGYLYVAFGDGGSAFDPENRSQNLNSYMGKLLRIDVSGGVATAPADNPYFGAIPGLDLIWASGLRNPWRLSFDRDTGDLWIGDVGQQGFDEINVQPADSTGGENYGWRAFEGNNCNIPEECAPIADDVTFPIQTFPPGGDGSAIVGGYVYRGSALPAFEGAYFYADFIQGTVGFLRRTPEVETTDLTRILNAGGFLCCFTSFGEDADGELYLVSQRKVYKIIDDGITYLDLEPVAQLQEPLFAAGPPGDASRLTVIQRGGVVRLVQNGELVETPFIDISDRVATDGELGLLGMAYHPDFATNGFVFLHYLRRTGEESEIIESVIARYTVNGAPAEAVTADPSSELIIITIPKEIGNHNGGSIAFSPVDGYLYIPMGDGGCCEDPLQNAQDLTRINGKILRIDVDNTDPGLNYAIPADNPFIAQEGVPDEIWAYGLRNPFRSSFDRVTGDFYFGDVGQNEIEEVHVQPAASPGGENYGWPIFEGSRCNTAVATTEVCDALEPQATFPVYEYDREFGSSVTGGSVYRGTAITGISGRYIFADYTYGRVYSFVLDGGVATAPREYTEDLDPDRELPGGYVALCEDGVGELYLISILGGVYKVVQGLGNDFAVFDDPEGEGEGEDQSVAGFTARLAPAADATLYEDVSGQTADGASGYLFSGRTGGNADNALRRALLYFDVAGQLPADAEINSATLRMRCSKAPVGSGEYLMGLHRLTRSWSEGPTATPGAGGAGSPAQEGDATWLHTFYDTASWVTPGGDFATPARAVQLVGNTGFYTWTNGNLADDIAAWLSAPATNFGWILVGDEVTNKSARRFDSRESITEQNRPELVVQYCGTPQDGWIFNPENGHYYRLTEEQTYPVAAASAACAGGYLATVNSAEENTWIVENIVGGFGDLYIGYYDTAEEGTFVWSNGETPGYENWDTGEPNDFNGAEDAAVINSNGLWNDVPVEAVGFGLIERDTLPFIVVGEGEGEGADEGEGEGQPVPSLEEAALDALDDYATADTDDNGALSEAEALAFFAAQYGGGTGEGSPAALLFNALDGNNDGVLGVGELRFAGGAASAVHAADTNGDGALSLSELLRVVQFYNAAAYACAENGGDTEDGYTLEGVDATCLRHSIDYLAPAFEITLSELLRGIQFYNTGGVTHCPGTTEDDFCPQG